MQVLWWNTTTRKSVRLPEDSFKSDLKNIQMFVFESNIRRALCHFLKLDHRLFRQNETFASSWNIAMFPFFLTDCKTAVLFFTKPKLMSLCSFFQTDKKPDTLWDGGEIVQNLHSFWDSLPKIKIPSSFTHPHFLQQMIFWRMLVT